MALAVFSYAALKADVSAQLVASQTQNETRPAEPGNSMIGYEQSPIIALKFCRHCLDY